MEAQHILGFIGNITAVLLFLSLVPTFLEIWRHQSTEQYSGYVYVAALLNCAIWVLYGLVHPNAVLVISINTIGFVIESIYIAIFVYYSTEEVRHKVLYALVAAMLFVGVILALVLGLAHSPEDKSLGFGIVGMFTGMGMYATPLCEMKSVMDTGSVESFSLLLCVVSLGNCVVWFIYAIIGSEPFVLVPNLVGVVCAVGQLALYAKFNDDSLVISID